MFKNIVRYIIFLCLSSCIRDDTFAVINNLFNSKSKDGQKIYTQQYKDNLTTCLREDKRPNHNKCNYEFLNSDDKKRVQKLEDNFKLTDLTTYLKDNKSNHRQDTLINKSYDEKKDKDSYGEISSITALPKTIRVRGYHRRDGTYVRGHYRSKSGNSYKRSFRKHSFRSLLKGW